MPKARRGGWVVWIVVGLAMVLAAGFLYHPPVAVLAPGEALDVTGDITITGMEVDEVDGSYLLTSVQLTRPNGIQLAISVLAGDQVMPISAVIPRGQDPEEFFEEQQRIFQESQMIAAGAAARAAGMDVAITGTGVRVVGIVPNSPAAGVLEEGDVVVAVNDQPIDVTTGLQDAIRSRPAGTRFTLTVERGGAKREVEIRSTSLPRSEGAVIGVFIETRDLSVDLPFEVTFTEREIGGPSAGLAYALAVADMLDPGDYAKGRTIATTGTINLEGAIGPVGGVEAKAQAAKAREADLFLVPAEEVDLARGGGIEVRGISNLKDAIAVLRATA